MLLVSRALASRHQKIAPATHVFFEVEEHMLQASVTISTQRSNINSMATKYFQCLTTVASSEIKSLALCECKALPQLVYLPSKSRELLASIHRFHELIAAIYLAFLCLVDSNHLSRQRGAFIINRQWRVLVIQILDIRINSGLYIVTLTTRDIPFEACKFEGDKLVQRNQISRWISTLQCSLFIALSVLSIVLFGITGCPTCGDKSEYFVQVPGSSLEYIGHILHFSWKDTS
jgi:hypothetical protein